MSFQIIHFKDFNINNIYFSNHIKNKIMHNGFFQILFYSTEYFSTQGAFIKMPFNQVSLTKYYRKYKCFFNIKSNANLLKNISKLEFDILEKNNPRKTKQLKITNMLKKGFFKIHNGEEIQENINCIFILKISGVWENQGEVGLTYRMFMFNHSAKHNECLCSFNHSSIKNLQ